MNRGYLTILGYILLAVGTLSIILGMVGLNLTYLNFLDGLGKTGKLIVQLLMIFGGVILMYLSRMEYDEEDLK